MDQVRVALLNGLLFNHVYSWAVLNRRSSLNIKLRCDFRPCAISTKCSMTLDTSDRRLPTTMVFPKQTSTSFFIWEPANRRTAQSVVLPPPPLPPYFPFSCFNLLDCYLFIYLSYKRNDELCLCECLVFFFPLSSLIITISVFWSILYILQMSDLIESTLQ